jgi:hypothetical protein
MNGTRSTHGEDEKCIKYFGWNTEGKMPLGRPWCRLEYNIRMNLREIEGKVCTA